jgi:hypothetical protein
MKKIDIGETMQLVANLSVIAGLFFLAFQVRQNTAAVQAQTLQGLVEASANFLENLGRDSETWTILEKLAEHPDQISQVDRRRLNTLVRAQFVRYQSAYLQWRKGSLSDEGWSIYLPAICDHPSAEGWYGAQALVWPTLRGSLLEGFRDLTEKCRPDFALIVETNPTADAKAKDKIE